MIAFLKGTVKSISANSVCVLTASGVGYEVAMLLPELHSITPNQEINLWTHLIVREDAHSLCGFLLYQDKQLFQTLIKVSGIGTKMAMAMLSAMNNNELMQCIEQGDIAQLTTIPGVGKKMAERLIFELQGKLVLASNQTTIKDSSNDALLALLSLGYKDKEAQNAIKIAKTQNPATTTEQLLKMSLRHLSRLG